MSFAREWMLLETDILASLRKTNSHPLALNPDRFIKLCI